MKHLIIASDLHLPFVHLRALELFLNVLREEKPDIVVLNGDIFDLAAFSSHDPPLEPLDPNELPAALVMFDSIKKACGDARIHFLEGNHETRLWRWLAKHAPHLRSLPSWLARSFGWFKGLRYHSYGEVVTIGKLRFVHDIGVTGPYQAQRVHASIPRNVVTGHGHRMQLVVLGNIEGERHCSATFGWMGDKRDATYATEAGKQHWQLGFGSIMIDDEGDVYMQPVPILEYKGGAKCLVNGKLYRTENSSEECSPKSPKISRSGKSSKSRQKKQSRR